MSEAIVIRIAAPKRGQFVQLALMPLGTPDLLVGDRAWVRLVRVMPTSQLHMIEAWGESESIERLFPSRTAKGCDEARLKLEKGEEDLALAMIPEVANDALMRGAAVAPWGAEAQSREWGKGVLIATSAIAPARAPWILETRCVANLREGQQGYQQAGLKLGAIGSIAAAQWVSYPLQSDDAETRQAMRNAQAFEHYGIAETWRGDFMGWPVTSSPWRADECVGLAVHLAPPENPNQPGVRGFYATSLAKLIWASDGVAREALDIIVREVAPQWLRRQAHWWWADGAFLLPYPRERDLTMHKGKPWIDDRSDPYCDLGHNKSRGTQWEDDELVEHDHQHEHGEILALAAMVTMHPAFALAARAKAVGLTYERSWVGALDGSWQVPFGRGAARTHDALLALAHVSSDNWQTARDATERWMQAELSAILARRIPRSRPAQIASLQPGNIWTGYEEGLLALTALRRWRMFGDPDALEVAYRCGRHVATSCYRTPEGSWATGYEIEFRGDGRPRLLTEGGIVVAKPPLATWSVAGLNAYMAAAAALARPEPQESLWLEIAAAARQSLTELLHDSPAEQLAQVQMTLWSEDIAALATRAGAGA